MLISLIPTQRARSPLNTLLIHLSHLDRGWARRGGVASATVFLRMFSNHEWALGYNSCEQEMRRRVKWLSGRSVKTGGSRKGFLTMVGDEVLQRKGDFLSKTRRVALCYTPRCFCPSSLNRRIPWFLWHSDDHPWVRFPWLSMLWSAKRQEGLPREHVSPSQWLPWIRLCNEAVCSIGQPGTQMAVTNPLCPFGVTPELLKPQVSKPHPLPQS